MGAHNEALDQVLNSVGKAIDVNMMTLLPHNTNGYYHWFGSLTTPPCTEDVEWYLFKEVPTLSQQQLKRFQKYYNHNYRPVQPLYDRKVEAH
ncbi:MAG: carbonic anhydrase family protein [Campylobacterales bacterium]|nr:carbonic anhydrase family protein [Campylobacterales bacterium]